MKKDGKYFGSYVVYVSWLGSYAVVQRGELGTTLDDIMHGFPEEMKWGSKGYKI